MHQSWSENWVPGVFKNSTVAMFGAFELQKLTEMSMPWTKKQNVTHSRNGEDNVKTNVAFPLHFLGFGLQVMNKMYCTKCHDEDLKVAEWQYRREGEKCSPYQNCTNNPETLSFCNWGCQTLAINPRFEQQHNSLSAFDFWRRFETRCELNFQTL